MTRLTQEKTSNILIKTTLAFTLILCFYGTTKAQSLEQNELSKNSVYLDTGIGIGGQVSINYERQLYSGEKVTWFGRIGTGAAYKFGLVNDEVTFGPGGLAAITMLTGKGNNHFEVNAGTFIVSDYYNDIVAYPLVDVGYRYQKPGGGFVFKAKIGLLGLGIGLGYAF